MESNPLKTYTEQRDHIIYTLKDTLRGTDSFICGSVARSQGPFNDVDLTIVSDRKMTNPPLEVNNIPVQMSYVESKTDLNGDIVSSRDITSLLDNIIVSDNSATITEALTKQREKLRGNVDYIINILSLEEQCETSSRDIMTNNSFFAMKRKSGSKRSIMRTCIIADALHTGLAVDDDRSRFEKLYAYNIIDHDTLLAMFSIQRMLPEWRHAKRTPPGWDRSLQITHEWTQDIVDQAIKYTARNPRPDYSPLQLNNLNVHKIITNPHSTPDELLNTWRDFASNPDRLHDISRPLVQHPNFPTQEIVGSDDLNKFPDIRFILDTNQ